MDGTELLWVPGARLAEIPPRLERALQVKVARKVRSRMRG